MNRYVRPVQFAFEPDVVTQFTRVLFGANGIPTLDTQNSKGVCDFSPSVFSFVGSVPSGSTSITVSALSSVIGLTPGMVITSSVPGVFSTTTTIISVSAGIVTISTATAAASGANATFTATALGATGISTGEYTMTFGSQFTPIKRLDSYVKLLGMSHIHHPLFGPNPPGNYPPAPAMHIVRNDVSDASKASVTLQFGSYSGATFTPGFPGVGEVVRITTQLCRSSAI